jgi:2-methylcitrate dehydratase PrpD
MTTIVDNLAAFIADTDDRTMDESVFDQAEIYLADVIGAVIGGLVTDAPTSSRLAARRSFGSGPAPIWLTGTGSSLPGAVFANTAAGNALDIDDGHRESGGHAGAAVVSAILSAACLDPEPIDGPKLLTAVSLGYEVALRVALSRRDADIEGFASGRWNGYGVAAGLSYLRGLPVNAIAHALAIAGAESPVNVGNEPRVMSSVKGSAAWGSLTGTFAVERAACGSTGPLDLLESASSYDASQILDDLGRRWVMLEGYLKPYSACRYAHSSIDAVLELREQIAGLNTRPDSISIHTFPEAVQLHNEPKPLSIEDAQFSIPFVVAVAYLRGASALRPIREESLFDAELLQLASSVRLSVDPAFDRAFPGATPSRVTVVAGEQTYSTAVLRPLGDSENPMARPDRVGKILDLATFAGCPEIVPELLDCIAAIKITDHLALARILRHDALLTSHGDSIETDHLY